jgi:hypothetical protein
MVRPKPVTIHETRTASQKMNKWWDDLKAKYGRLLINEEWCEAFEHAYRARQRDELDVLLREVRKRQRAPVHLFSP